MAHLLLTSLLLEGSLSLIFSPLTAAPDGGVFAATGQRSDPSLAALTHRPSACPGGNLEQEVPPMRKSLASIGKGTRMRPPANGEVDS